MTLKLRGIYFSLSVFAFAEVVNAVFRAFEVFGGPAGIAAVPRPALFGTRLNTHLQFYYVVLVVSLVSLFFLYRLQWTRFGFTLLALRTSATEALAESIGINAARHKTFAFVVSCFFCGVMGAVHVHYLRFVSPFVFTFFLSTDLMVYVMVGGLGSYWGPMLGTVLLTGPRRAALRRRVLQEPRLRGRAARRHPRVAGWSHLAAADLPARRRASSAAPAAAEATAARER